MTQAERAELAASLLKNLIAPDLTQVQLAEVRRRIAQVETGEVVLVPGEEALSHVRRLVASARAASQEPSWRQRIERHA